METIGTRLLPGAPLRNHLLGQIPAALVALASPPQLVIVQVGSHPASTVYVRHKQAACAKVGLNCVLEQVAEAAGEHALHRLLRGLAQAPDVTGILLQLPLPGGWDVVTALGMIPALKDVDGLCPENQQHRRIWPATPVGVLRLLPCLLPLGKALLRRRRQRRRRMRRQNLKTDTKLETVRTMKKLTKL